MHEQLIPTPWDLFCAGHIELPDGNILVAGGTARYENLDPTYAAGSMTVMNNDTAQAWTLPKGTIFTTSSGVKFASATAISVPRATKRPGTGGGQPTVVAGQQNVWVNAVAKGKGSLIATDQQYQVQGLVGPQAGHLLYGVGTPMTLQKQNFQGTKDAYIFDVKTLRYVKVNSMNYARWYPTLAEMGNGMDMAISGLNGAGQITMNSEMFNPTTKTWAAGPGPRVPDLPGDVPDRERAAVLHRLQRRLRPVDRGLAHARVLEHQDQRRSRPVPGIPGSAGPGDQRLGPAAARPESDDHGPRRRRCRPVEFLHGPDGADRRRRPGSARGCADRTWPSPPATPSPCCCRTTTCW